MAWAHVGSTATQENTTSQASLQLNLAQTATNGNALVVWAAVNAASLPGLGSGAITDSAGNTWVEELTVTDATRHNRLSCFRCKNVSGAPTWVKITPSISAFITIISADEYSSVDTVAAPQTSSAGPTSSGSATAGSLTPTNANSLCTMAITHAGSASETLAADTGNGYTERGHQPSTTGTPGESQDASKTAATNPAVTIGGTPFWIAGMVVFAPAAAANNPPPRGLMVRPPARHYSDAWG